LSVSNVSVVEVHNVDELSSMVIEYYGDPFSKVPSYQCRKPKEEKSQIFALEPQPC
jgi:hypothetical protein